MQGDPCVMFAITAFPFMHQLKECSLVNHFTYSARWKEFQTVVTQPLVGHAGADGPSLATSPANILVCKSPRTGG